MTGRAMRSLACCSKGRLAAGQSELSAPRPGRSTPDEPTNHEGRQKPHAPPRAPEKRGRRPLHPALPGRPPISRFAQLLARRAERDRMEEIENHPCLQRRVGHSASSRRLLYAPGSCVFQAFGAEQRRRIDVVLSTTILLTTLQSPPRHRQDLDTHDLAASAVQAAAALPADCGASVGGKRRHQTGQHIGKGCTAAPAVSCERGALHSSRDLGSFRRRLRSY